MIYSIHECIFKALYIFSSVFSYYCASSLMFPLFPLLCNLRFPHSVLSAHNTKAISDINSDMGARKSSERDTGEIMGNECDGRKLCFLLTILSKKGESCREVVDQVSVCFHILSLLH